MCIFIDQKCLSVLTILDGQADFLKTCWQLP
uniref:Uncharacterized protein n=1 Tax=Anguilla anguilla TaxID=7936 RepID=A0A0E9T3X9_ANGAN